MIFFSSQAAWETLSTWHTEQTTLGTGSSLTVVAHCSTWVNLSSFSGQFTVQLGKIVQVFSQSTAV